MADSKQPWPSSFICKPVDGGWQTQNTMTGQLIGPVFEKVNDLWDWQVLVLSTAPAKKTLL